MATVFISYSRKDITFAKRLTAELQKCEMDFWIDWEGIPPTVDWWKEIEKGIEEADIFLFLISPDSSASKVCGQEIDTAVKNAKRIVPLVVREIKGDEAPKPLGRLNWIFFRESDDFDASFQKLLTSIHTDFEWVKEHRWLQVRALDWQRENKDRGALLRGKDLLDAETNLAVNSSREPHPTDLQREYVLQSRKATDRQRGILMSLSIGGFIALAALAVFGFVQATNATAQAKIAETQRANAVAEANGRATAQANAEISAKLANERAILARARELVAQSQSVASEKSNFQLSMLLGIEAYRTAKTPQTTNMLLSNLLRYPHLAGYIDMANGVSDGPHIAISPDGKILATGGPEHSIILWDLVRRQQIGQPLRVHTKRVTSLAFSPDGTILASSSIDSSIVLWDIANSRVIGTPLLVDPGSSVDKVIFSPDGKTLASVGYPDERVIMWDVSTRTAQGGFPASNVFANPWSTAAFSPDGKIFASAGCGSPGDFCPEGEIILRDTTPYKTQDPVELTDTTTYKTLGILHGHSDTIVSLAFSPDSKTLASSSSDGTIILWNLDTRLPEGEPLRTTDGMIHDIAFSPDGKKLVSSGGNDNTVVLWDLEIYPPVAQTLIGHTGYVNSVVFSPDGKQIISAGCAFGSNLRDCNQSEIIIWEVDTQNQIAEKVPYDYGSSDVDFSSDGKILAAAYPDSTIILWDVAKRKSIGESLHHPDDFVTTVAFSPDGKILASAGGKTTNTVILWDVSTHKIIGKPLIAGTERTTGLEFSPDSTRLAAVSGSAVYLWNVSSGQPIAAPINLPGLWSLGFSPNSKILALGSCEKLSDYGICDSAEVILWSIALGQPIGKPLIGGQHGLVRAIAFSPDGRTLAAGTGGNGNIGGESSINIWNLETRQQIGATLTGDFSDVNSIAFSPDGKTLAAGTQFAGVILWDVSTRLPININTPLSGDSLDVYGIAYGPDGRVLAISSNDGVSILGLDPEYWIEKTCQRASRNFTASEWLQFFPEEGYRKTCDQWSMEPDGAENSASEYKRNLQRRRELQSQRCFT